MDIIMNVYLMKNSMKFNITFKWKMIFFVIHNKIYKMQYTGIWSNVISVDVCCSKCKSKINTYYPNKCVVCRDVFCYKCLKKCNICKSDYCKKCRKLYRFKNGTCNACYQPNSKCIIC